MHPDHLTPDDCKRLEEIVGYLDFSSGAEDPRFLANLNALYGALGSPQSGGHPSEPGSSDKGPTWRRLGRLIEEGVARLRGSSPAFREVRQAESVVRLVFDEVLPAYRRHHRDLLFHQTDEFLFQPFFLGRVCEAVLAEGGPWSESARIVDGALKRLNDFMGHRPLAVLETERKIEPYAHERVRPIPLYIEGAGVSVGPYHDVIERALALLRSTDEDLLERAWFDPALLHELALDPRAYDFDHPVNRRPNYHFGGWDPHHIDSKGRYRRFVLQQVTLDALAGRVGERADLPRHEVLLEAAAVLAGTMLMGSGITGNGPDAHDSSTTLATLLPVIAGYRDEFYERLIQRISPEHAERLRAEAATLRQPFGGARQHLNQALARRRAEQTQRVHLARLFARMGYTEAARRQVQVVPVASARMRCDIDCRLTTAHLQIDRGQLDAAAAQLPEIEDLLHRAIECGAMVDPWNILGFGGQFSVFPAPENSIHDHRIDELIDLMNDLFALYARLEKEAAAAGRPELGQALSDRLAALAQWWDQFASTEVSGVAGVSGAQAWESAGQVARAIAAWHEAGTAAGDVAFWKKHVEEFRAPKAFALLAETLIERGDLVASMALLMLWLSQADQVPLAEADYSFHELALRWMEKLWGIEARSGPGQAGETAGWPGSSEAGPPKPTPVGSNPAFAGSPRSTTAAHGTDRWTLAAKFFDYLEANADQYWTVPRLELAGQPAANGSSEDDEGDDDTDGLFSAAYENVTYRDTTDDGFEGEMLEGGAPATDFELALEAERISGRLALLATVARLWKLVAAASAAPGFAASSPGGAQAALEDRDATLSRWLAQAEENRRGLLDLLQAVYRYRVTASSGALEAMIEYDRRRAIRDGLLERIIEACVETDDAARFLPLFMDRQPPASGAGEARSAGGWEEPARRVLRAAFGGNVRAMRAHWPELLETLSRQPLLYVPVARGGHPQRIVASRSVQRTLARLLLYAPRLGLLSETYQLLETIQAMERNHPVGPGAITEFDRLFEIGCRGICECVVVSAQDWVEQEPGKKHRGKASPRRASRADERLVQCLERVAGFLFQCWMDHSRNIRLSVLEGVSRNGRWQRLKRFIRSYGADLFTQPFMNYGNLRAILHQGAEAYLRSLEERAEDQPPLKLLGDLGGKLSREDAARWLETVAEAVLENYSEYTDYNSTTTQSDRGEMLYTLLDFLRVLASYNRMAWNMKPIVIVHEVLVRKGRNRAAELWRATVAERTAGVADEHLDKFHRLSRRYGMRLPSVAERLGERFVRPLDIGRLCALVRPSIAELQENRPPESFPRLEREVARFAKEPGGVGYEPPAWLEALEEEAERARLKSPPWDDPADPGLNIPQVRLSRKQVQRQIDWWEDHA